MRSPAAGRSAMRRRVLPWVAGLVLLAAGGCDSHSASVPGRTTQPSATATKAVDAREWPTTIVPTCKSADAYTFSPGYDAQRLGTSVVPSSLLASEFGTTYSEVFVSARHGYALAVVNSQTYPAETTDGGLTWHINGPMLYRAAADAGRAVAEIGAAPPDWVYIWGTGNLIDFSTDGGSQWCEANMGGPVLSVGANPPAMWAIRGLPPEPALSSGETTTYASGDGGRTWSLSRASG